MNSNLNIIYYHDLLLRLRRGNCCGVVSNAKPLFLITTINMINDNEIVNNKIYFDSSLFEHYLQVCRSYDPTSPATPIYKPFFYLCSDGFYNIQWKSPITVKDPPSSRFVRENAEYAYFDNALWDILQIKEVREEYTKALVDYFIKTN